MEATTHASVPVQGEVDSEESTSDVMLVSKNTKADVWKHFALRADQGGKAIEPDKPLCKLCCVPVCEKYGNTTSLYVYQHPQVVANPKVCPTSQKIGKDAYGTTQEVEHL